MRCRTPRSMAALHALVMLVVALVLSACSVGERVDVSGGAEFQPTDNTLLAAIAGEPDQLDPHVTTSYFSFQVLENVYDTLVEPDEQLRMQPALATEWTTSADNLTWTFTLRDGVTFHDGSPFTSEDVVYSFRRIIDEELSSSWRLTAVKSVTAPDPRTVVFTLTQPTPHFLTTIGSFKGLAIVSKANVDAGRIQTRPVGTGPFSVASFTAGDDITLRANPQYWGGAPQVDGAVIRFIPEPSTAMAALRSGEVHWTDAVPPQDVPILAKDSTVHLGRTPSNDYWYVTLNEARKPFDDVRVRQAVAFAIDRDSVAQAAKYGAAQVNQTAIPASSPWYLEHAPYTHDPERARQLLQEAGVGDLSVELMVTSEYPETVTIAQVLADQLSQAGIRMTIRTLDFATWLDEQGQGNWDSLMLGWLGNNDPDDYYYGQHHSKGTNNFQKYSNPEVDRLLDAGRAQMDEAARKKTYDQAATIIVDEASYIYLYNPDVLQVWSPNLHGYTTRSDRAVRFRDVSIGGE